MYNRGPDPAPGAVARLLAAVLLLAAGGALALPEDRQEPIRITADKAVRDEKNGFTVYQGNVMMQQGTLRIDATKVTVFHSDKEADRIKAEGSPAHMREQPQADKGLMHARAEVIEYFKAEERVLLKRNASVEQDGSRVAGDSIEYFIGQQLIRADSSASGRVEVVMPAPSNSQDESSGAASDNSAEEEPGGTTDGQ